ncbi:fluoride efflux transporter FluC [Psychromicrobium sp. YIM B11713]|uniref:fluoride efflux transporter FluC n=1 Tax=Psychromicrobium sp. YIM B11713 TaxID=3145233 RepID=UPI00374EC132
MTSPTPWPPFSAWLSVAIAGIIGSELRYSLGLIFPESATSFPFTTLLINVVGSLSLGALTGYWARRTVRWWIRAAFGPGLLGSFTTFSAVVYAIDHFAATGQTTLWVLYLGLTLLAGLFAAWLGLRLGERWPRSEGSRA